ncbi:MAG: integrase [Pseudobdellovibrionaceae bacterium]|nr:MAG: integrase [Pseudobdellovibrionaceae bacterium]
MDRGAVNQYLTLLRQSYQVTSYQEKQKIIDVVGLNFGWHRKSVIRALNRPDSQRKSHPGRKRKYSAGAIIHLKKVWLKMDQMCSKRMRAALPRWLKDYNHCSDAIKEELMSMGASTIDRYLRSYKAQLKRKNNTGTRPVSDYFKNRIPIKPLDHNVHEAGVVEADTVAHCGDSLSGVFAWSLTLTDVKTGWTEVRAQWGKSGIGVVNGITNIEENLPFKIKEFCCDNGSEFLNHQLLNYMSQLGQAHKIKRGRPYRKNDQCHVEQKNYTHVRQLFGYHRIDQKELIELMNDIYANEWSQLQNYFMPQMKLIRKTRIGSKYKREYSKPMTPYDRIMAEPTISSEVKARLKRQYDNLNPFALKEALDRKVNRFFKLVNFKPIRNAS